jgi:hypothetical protein
MTEPRTSRRRWIVGCATAVVLAGSGVATVAVRGAGAQEGGDEPVTTVAAPTSTAVVERRDLVESESVTGTVGYGDTSTVKLGGSSTSAGGGEAAAGTVTAQPDVGTVIERGVPLLEVDGQPAAILLVGERPMWRELRSGVDDGPDIRQLEQNLVDMGFATSDELTVDEEWTSMTTEIVKDWQESLGLERTGRVAVGDVVFVDGPVRVASNLVTLGDTASGPVVELSGTERAVHIDLDAASADAVSVGDAVTVELATGEQVDGTVTSVADTATVSAGADGTSTTTFAVEVGIDDSVVAPDGIEVTVELVTQRWEQLLTVPVKALLALAEGGYAVERVTATGTELVAVSIGRFGDGVVEIDGDVAVGDTVVVP